MAAERKLNIREGILVATTTTGEKIRFEITRGRLHIIDGQQRPKSEKVKTVPEGAIDSLRPLIREAFNLYKMGQDGGFWTDIVERAQFSPSKAAAKLRRARFTILESAELVINTTDEVTKALGYGDINEDTKKAFVSTFVTEVRKAYRGDYYN